MTFDEKFEQYLQRVYRIREQLDDLSEEATKNALIMPFFSMLGYDVFDTNEFTPEFTCDVATKKGEKIDYAIMKDGEPTMLIECKRAGMKLQKQQQAQLIRYFSTNRCRIAILTNGIIYHFFSDLNAPNIMDDEPFLSFNLLEDDSTIYRSSVQQFQKETFDVKNVISKAVFQKYAKVVEKTIREDLESPSDALVKYFLSRPEIVTGSRITSHMIDKYREVTKAALLKVFAKNIIQVSTEEKDFNKKTVKEEFIPQTPEESLKEIVKENATITETSENQYVENVVEEKPSVTTFASADEIFNYISDHSSEIGNGISCTKEDNIDFIRLHIYTSNTQKLAVLKIMKSDMSLQLRKFTNGIPSAYPVQSIEDVINALKL